MTKSKVNLNDTYSKYLDLLGIVNIIKSERHGYFIPIAKRRISFNNKRILFAGDSAGFADPVTAEGISAAILSVPLCVSYSFNRIWMEKLQFKYTIKKYPI